MLAQPAAVPASPDLVDRAAWWTVPGTLATVSVDQWPCGGDALAVGGRPQPPVDDPGGVLLDMVGDALGQPDLAPTPPASDLAPAATASGRAPLSAA